MSSNLTPPRTREELASLVGQLDPTVLLIALLGLLFHHASNPPAPAPTPGAPGAVPPAPPVPAPAPAPAPHASIADRMPVHRIDGGEAHVTGIVDMSVRHVQTRLPEEVVDMICARTARAPRDFRLETDCTPSAEDGYVFGPNDPAWVTDPQPGSVDDPEAQPMRLLADLGAGLSGGVRHVNPNFGCDNWLRVAGQGDVTNLRYVGPSYQGSPHAEIPLQRKGQAVTVIHVG
jgi:hypothetical protein